MRERIEELLLSHGGKIPFFDLWSAYDRKYGKYLFSEIEKLSTEEISEFCDGVWITESDGKLQFYIQLKRI